MIVDMHTHLFGAPRKFFHGVARYITHEFAKQGIHESNEEIGDSLMETSDDPDAEGLLAEMDGAGIDKSVLLPADFGLALGEAEISIEEINKRYAELAQKHPDRLIAFVGVDPRRTNALDLFKRGIEHWGMRGLKLLPSSGFYPNQKEVYPLLEKACEWKIPVIIHSGATMVHLRSKYSEAMYFDDLAVDFPALPIIAAHGGGVLDHAQMLSIMHLKLNIMIDISGWQIIATKNYPYFCRTLREFMDFTEPERIFFGSDRPGLSTVMSNDDWVALIKNLPQKAVNGITFKEEEITALLGTNAQKLLNL